MILFQLHTSRRRHHRGNRHGKHAIVKVPGKREWIVRGLNTGRILGRHPSRKKALEQLRAVERSMHGR